MRKIFSNSFLFLKNLISYLVLCQLRLFLKNYNNKEYKNTLFVNTGQIGDLIVTSLIFENEDLLPENRNYYFLFKLSYKDLFSNYSGKAKIIFYDYKKYRYSFLYRYRLLLRLRRTGFKTAYSITATRGPLNDELVLLSGAERKYATSASKKYLGNVFGKIYDKMFDKILFTEIKNEYQIHEELIRLLSGKDIKSISFNCGITFSGLEKKSLSGIFEPVKKEYILVSPLSTQESRTWGAENFSKLCTELSEMYTIVLTASLSEKSKLENIKKDNINIIVDFSPLDVLPYIVYNAKYIIGGDSGITHIAMKLNKPFTAIIDGGYFGMYFPYRTFDKKFLYIYNKLDCFGCLLDCIYDEMKCLTELKYDNVFTQVRNHIKEFF